MDTRDKELAMRMEKLHWIRHILHRNAISDLPLYRAQMPLLEYINRYPGSTQVEAAQTLLISPSSVAQSTKRMQRDGLIEKQVDDDNQRCKRLHLTEKGRGLMEKCRLQFDEVDRLLFESLSENEKELLHDLIARLLANAALKAQIDVESMDIFSFLKLKKALHGCTKKGGS